MPVPKKFGSLIEIASNRKPTYDPNKEQEGEEEGAAANKPQGAGEARGEVRTPLGKTKTTKQTVGL